MIYAHYRLLYCDFNTTFCTFKGSACSVKCSFQTIGKRIPAGERYFYAAVHSGICKTPDVFFAF